MRDEKEIRREGPIRKEVFWRPQKLKRSAKLQTVPGHVAVVGPVSSSLELDFIKRESGGRQSVMYSGCVRGLRIGRVDMASLAVLSGVLLALTLLPSGLAAAPQTQRITQAALAQFSSLANRTIIMALHEAKPFVFFDCSWEDAIQDWNAKNPTNPKDLGPVPTKPVEPPRPCKREKECPDAPDSEPFCGITVEIARDVCTILNCSVKFYIASENPHHWESEDAALRAIGAGLTVGTTHWADAAGGALIISSERTQIAHFTTPYFQTGFRLVTRRPAKEIDLSI